MNGSCVPVTTTPPTVISKAPLAVITKTSALLLSRNLAKGLTPSPLKVGCDGMRNSAKTNDQCGVCGGSGTSCRKVSATFDKALPARGLQRHILCV